MKALLAPHLKTLEDFRKADMELEDEVATFVLEMPCLRVTTDEFLLSFQYYCARTPYLHDEKMIRKDMRAYWWQPDGDVQFTHVQEEKFEMWRSWMDRERMKPRPHYSIVLQQLQTTVGKAVEQYRHPFLFETTWDEFLQRLDDPFVIAAIRQMEQLRSAGEDIELTIFCSMLANRELRQRVFGF